MSELPLDRGAPAVGALTSKAQNTVEKEGAHSPMWIWSEASTATGERAARLAIEAAFQAVIEMGHPVDPRVFETVLDQVVQRSSSGSGMAPEALETPIGRGATG